MSESTERFVAFKIRTDASGKKCAKSCPYRKKHFKGLSSAYFCTAFESPLAMDDQRLNVCRAAEIEVDGSALEIADTIIETTRECEDQNYLAQAYRDFCKAAGK